MGKYDFVKSNKFLHSPSSFDVKYFSQINLSRKIELKKNCFPNAVEIISNIIDYEVTSIKLVDNVEAMSYEGKFSSGNNILVNIKFKEKIMYLSNDEERLLNIIESEFYHRVPIVVEKKIGGVDIKNLIRKDLVKNKLSIEHTNVRLIDNRTFVRHLFFLLELYFI